MALIIRCKECGCAVVMDAAQEQVTRPEYCVCIHCDEVEAMLVSVLKRYVKSKAKHETR